MKTSLHDTILQELEARILSGAWPPGHKVPSELELCGQFACSRMTVNKVMTQLAAAGLILRRRRVGSVVLPQKSQNSVLEIHSIKEEVLLRGGWYRHEILSCAVMSGSELGDTPDLLAPLGEDMSAAVTPLLRVTCLHYSDDAPFCYEDRLIYLDAVPNATDERFAEMPPGTWLLEHVPWSEAETEIGAEDASMHVAAALGIEPGAACLSMTRRTWKNGEAVTAVSLRYPGRQHRLKARFTPASG